MDLIERIMKNEWQRTKAPPMILGPLVEALTDVKMQEIVEADKKQAAPTTAAGAAGFGA